MGTGKGLAVKNSLVRSLDLWKLCSSKSQSLTWVPFKNIYIFLLI